MGESRRKAKAPAATGATGKALAVAFAIVAFLAPLKFGNPAAIPELPTFPGGELIFWVFFNWPPLLMPLITGLLLLGCLTLLPKPRRGSPALICSLAWAALAFCSLLGFVNASVRDFPLHECAHIFSLAAYALAVFRFAEVFPERRKWLIIPIVAATACICLSAIEQYQSGFDETRDYVKGQEAKLGVNFSQDFHNRLDQNRVYATFAIPNSLAAHLLLTIPLCLWGCWALGGAISRRFPRVTRTSSAVLLAVAAAATLGVLGLTGSRAAILCLVGAVGLAVVIFPFAWRWRLTVCAAAVVLGVCAIAMIHLSSNANLNSISSRLDYNQVSTRIFMDNPLLGTGWGDFFHEYGAKKRFQSDEAPRDPHNLVLSFAAQTGVLGLLAACAVLLLPLLHALREARHTPDWRATLLERPDFAIYLGFLAWGLHALADVDIQIPGSAVTALTMLAVAMARPAATPNDAPAQPAFGAVWTTASVIVALAAIWLAAQTIPTEMAYQKMQDLCDFRNKSPEEFRAVTLDDVDQALANCVKLAPHSPYPWALAASFAQSRGLFAAAERDNRAAIERSPERASFHYHLAQALISQGRIDEADVAFQHAIALHPFAYQKNYAHFLSQKKALKTMPRPFYEYQDN